MLMPDAMLTVQRAIYATPSSGRRCTRCDTNWSMLYEYRREGIELNGFFCSDYCACAFHPVNHEN